VAEFLFNVVDWHDKFLLVELSIRRDTVECRCGGRLEAIFDRDTFEAWLAAPMDSLTDDTMTWQATDQGVAIAVQRVFPRQNVSPTVVEVLRHQLAELAGR
jgi:hypothetical protein